MAGISQDRNEKPDADGRPFFRGGKRETAGVLRRLSKHIHGEPSSGLGGQKITPGNLNALKGPEQGSQFRGGIFIDMGVGGRGGVRFCSYRG